MFLGEEKGKRINIARAEEFRPDVVINAAAYTAVDQAETAVGEAWRLNALAPGNTHTPLTVATLADPEIGPLMEAVPVPIGRWAEPDEIAAAATWMLGGDSSFLLGAVLFVDGGTDALVRPDTF